MSATYRTSSRVPDMYRHDSHSRSSQPSSPSTNDHLSVRPSFPETFLDDLTPIDNIRDQDSADDDDRDPHDLSLNPKHGARTSVVDNMLLSLDQFSPTDITSGFDGPGVFHPMEQPDPYSSYSHHSSSRYDRFRSHTLSSSVSSDVESYTKDSMGIYASRQIRGRRSNSSSNNNTVHGPNYPSIRQVHSVHEGEKPTTRTRAYDSQRAVCAGDRVSITRSSRLFRRDSGSSTASSSVDLNQMLTSNKIGRGRRSASFDCASGAFPLPPRGNSLPFGQLDNVTNGYDDLNAAPTPNIPVGPRRNHSSSFNEPSNIPMPSVTSHPTLNHKASTKSARSMYVRKGRSDTLGTATIRSRNDEYKHFADSNDDIPPVPSFVQPSAPSPIISRHKPIHFASPTEANITPPIKERQGFFRRVFGSSKNSSPTQQPDRNTFPSADRGSMGPAKGHQSAPNSSKGYKPPPNNNHSSGTVNSTRATPQVITKKPSSFFRRRKKSVADHVPPPLTIPHSNITSMDQHKWEPPTNEHLRTGAGAEPSPISSLRNVMKPYISDVDSPRHRDPGFGRSRPSTNDTENESPGRDRLYPSDSKLKYKKESDRTYPSKNQGPRFDTDMGSNDFDSSFLADSSGNEGGGGKNVSRRRPKTSPSVPTRQSPRPNDQYDSMPTSPAHEPASEISVTATRSSQGLTPKITTKPHVDQQESDASQHETAPSTAASDQPIDSPIIDAPESALEKSSRASLSTVSNYHTASNTPIIPDSVGDTPVVSGSQPLTETTDLPNLDPLPPRSEEQELAEKIFNQSIDDDITANQCSAAWFGNPKRALVRKAYMDLFDWPDMNILAALRSLCSKIALKGEAQEVDRVLDAFSTRWCECNPNHGFKAIDVVHTICYSTLLLNTDLHLASVDHKMTKTQFIRNTMPTIQRVLADAAPDAFSVSYAKTLQDKRASETDRMALTKSPTATSETHSMNSPTGGANTEELKPNGTATRMDKPPTPLAKPPSRASLADSGPLVSTPFNGTMRAWEIQVESVLKEFYTAIQKQRLPLRGVSVDEDENSQVSNNFFGLTANMLRRTPSTVSRTGSDIFPRGRGTDNRLTTARWSSKPRSRSRLYPASTMTSSRTSLDDQSSIWSPSGSSTWSKNSLGKTLTSMSVDSLGSHYHRSDYQQSIGFANALSHAIIREDQANMISDTEESSRTGPLLDETLELAGAPWAKEGSLKHKHHFDSVDKRAKDRNWNESFAVIQRGWMRLFSFNASSKSMRLKPKQRQANGLVVGGGNWMENAEETWKFLLRHTIASTLPAPGYSKTRPHVWALSLPTGAVHLFQAGTPEIVREFVSTANYWSARLSKEPLFGAISNVEYGWSDSVINRAATQIDESRTHSGNGARPSLQSSIRSSLDQQIIRPRLPADRIVISDWHPPQQSMIASNLSETGQLETLRKYVKHVEQELDRHNELRPALVIAFTPRHANYSKAMHNWERKSSYLLRELVKFSTYIDCLQAAQMHKERLNSSSANDERETATPEAC
ncbi:hypothetical protein FQN57_002213 [Myotisia sp. PD_48]|nr:hypothetical protein FQN57_002213 [Myotisia sp. PD_48]